MREFPGKIVLWENNNGLDEYIRALTRGTLQTVTEDTPPVDALWATGENFFMREVEPLHPEYVLGDQFAFDVPDKPTKRIFLAKVSEQLRKAGLDQDSAMRIAEAEFHQWRVEKSKKNKKRTLDAQLDLPDASGSANF